MAVGEAVEVAEGVMGVVGTCEELTRLAAGVEVGVAAVDGLERKKKKSGRKQQLKLPRTNQYLCMIKINTMLFLYGVAHCFISICLNCYL